MSQIYSASRSVSWGGKRSVSWGGKRSVSWGGRALAMMLAIALLLPTVMVAPTSLASAKAQPELLALAAEQPQSMVRIIAQADGPATGFQEVVEALGGRYLKDLSIINAFAAEMSAAMARKLASNPAVRWVSLDAPVERSAKPIKPDPNATPNTYLQTLGVQQAWSMGYDGSGIGVAIIDSGLSVDPDFTNVWSRTSFSSDSNNVNDVYGHGSHVAGIIAGNGTDSAGFYKGVAPGVRLNSMKISDAQGMAYESDVVEAMQWVLNNRATGNIRIVNLSVNSTSEMSYHQSPMDAAAEILWFNGIVVIASVGNRPASGSWDPIKSAPANDPFLITVGATNENGTSQRSDDFMATFSANGMTGDGYRKPDVLAPGKNIYSVLSKDSSWDDSYPDRCTFSCQYFRLSGTSMSAPMVTGAVALLLQKEPGLTPDQVKYRLMNTGSIVYGDFASTGNEFAYLDVYAMLTTPTTASSNTGQTVSNLLTTGSEPVNSSVSWNSVSWNSVSWNSVSWNSVSWNSVSWNSVSWNSVSWNN